MQVYRTKKGKSAFEPLCSMRKCIHSRVDRGCVLKFLITINPPLKNNSNRLRRANLKTDVEVKHMDSYVNRCKSCGIVFSDMSHEIDKCANKKPYCELCLAQKDPRSVTEQQIKKKYILTTALFALITLIILIFSFLEKSKNDSVFEYIVGFGIGYVLIWICTAILFTPILMLMKKPHRAQINREKERYKKKIEEKKNARKSEQEQPEKKERR